MANVIGLLFHSFPRHASNYGIRACQGSLPIGFHKRCEIKLPQHRMGKILVRPLAKQEVAILPLSPQIGHVVF